MELIFSVVILAFIFELMDSSAGMGFGTGLTPLLLLMGYDPLQVTPILLISEAITGLTSGFFHHEFQNTTFSFCKLKNAETKITLYIAFIGCLAIMGSVILTYFALEVPTQYIKTYVAILVLLMGCIGILKMKIRTTTYRPKLLWFLSGLAGFNKGIGAGGYGPVTMMGQLFSGIYEKTATAIVSISEGIVSIVGFTTFILLSSYGVTIDFLLLPSVFSGGFIAAIISPYLVRIIPNKFWKIIIPIYALSIGIYLLAKIYIL